MYCTALHKQKQMIAVSFQNGPINIPIVSQWERTLNLELVSPLTWDVANVCSFGNDDNYWCETSDFIPCKTKIGTVDGHSPNEII